MKPELPGVNTPIAAPSTPADGRGGDLADRYRDVDAPALLEAMICREFPGRIALVSSFGAEAAVLAHMVARIDAATPVVFIDTGKLFGETLRYRDRLTAQLGLTDVRTIRPDTRRLESVDADGVLWYGNPDMCCYVRRVEPLQRALRGFEAWISGRKSIHGGARTGLDRIEVADDGRIKINALADWKKADLDRYFEKHELPRHPLEADGFLSIGCMPCTDRVQPGEDLRAGRWRGSEKTECGIHLPAARWKMNGIDG